MMNLIEQNEIKLGKRFREWSQEERFSFASTLEEPDIRLPLLVHFVMEAYTSGKRDILRPSVLKMIETAIAQKERR